MFNIPARILTLLLILGIILERGSMPSAADAKPYHEQVARLIDDIPVDFGPWRGSDVPVPEPAQTVLKAKICARQFVNPGTRRAAELVVVHCRDSRDLQGHYPPNCYPANGWVKAGQVNEVEIEIGDMMIPLRRYEFEQSTIEEEKRLTVYGTFAIPGAGLVTRMAAVQEAAADVLVRPFGAAQIQVVFRDRLTQAEERTIARELLVQAMPTIRWIVAAPVAGLNGHVETLPGGTPRELE